MRGRILLNGNGGSELIERAAPYVLGSAKGRPPRVLLVTAAWGRGEYHEAPIKGLLNQVGVPSDVVGGYDRNIQNLCAWHAWTHFLAERPWVQQTHADIEGAMRALRSFYLDKCTFFADVIRKGASAARAVSPSFSLGKVHGRDSVRPESIHNGRELFESYLGEELVASIEGLTANDDRMLDALTYAQDQLLTRTGLRLDPAWVAQRQELEARILWADAILFFGGSPEQLLAPFRFFDLRPALLETLRRGATLVASSAGALVLCDRVIVYDQFSNQQHRDFQVIDRGLGIVSGLQVLPHCMDRIQTDDPDNLAYLARRFSKRLSVGLNRESYLLIEPGGPRATAVGEVDGVYVFGADGQKVRYGAGQSIPL